MGRYVSVQAYGDNNPKVVQVPYEQATGGRELQSGGRGERVKTEKVENVMGSTAGAGSGEFHTYRAHRRLEMFRVENMEKSAKEEEAQAAFDASVAQKRKETEERARKNAEKRKRKKMKKSGGGKAAVGGSSSTTSHDGGSESEGEAAGGGKEGGDGGGKLSVYEVPVTIKDDGSFLETMKKLMAGKAKQASDGAAGEGKGDQPA